MTQNKNLGIQWMRAIAALLVVVDHSLFTLIDKAGADASMAPFAALLGAMGVKLFFLISGFVMIVSSTSRFGPAASLDFMRRRLIRIVPLYWITSLIYTVKLSQTGDTPGLTTLLQSLFYIPYMNSQGEMQPVYGLGWTLNYEIFFYLIFAIGLLGSLRSTLIVVASSLLLLVGYGLSLAPTDAGTLGLQIYFWSRPIVLFFLMGMSLPYILQRLLRWESLPKFSFGLAAAVSTLLVAIALALARGELIPQSFQLLLLSLPLLLISLAQPSASAFGFARVARLLGDASYSIYLTHSFIIGPMGRLYGKLGLQAPFMFTVVSLLLCAFVGILTFRYVETPIIRMLTARTSGSTLINRTA
jgi:exopolysaccharide production protein ExoZ